MAENIKLSDINTHLILPIHLQFSNQNLRLGIIIKLPTDLRESMYKQRYSYSDKSVRILTKAQKKKQVKEYQKQFIKQQRTKQDINASKTLEIANPSTAIYPEIRNLQKQINQKGTQEPIQVNEPMHQRQPSSSNANTMEQPLVQTEGNNEQIETEKRETVSKNQVSESAETGPLTTQ
ncbi:Hypothetical_protein [Hexamita inflata]|uniref:Hypothetical_protein n=1 Tax=Hexamita inflata TaxID=28002 RepID=A0AA86QIY5_9EUKA|nr:Hypothetical protein HINF_LOCUS42067 [Hexamita inflata]